MSLVKWKEKDKDDDEIVPIISLSIINGTGRAIWLVSAEPAELYNRQLSCVSSRAKFPCGPYTTTSVLTTAQE